MKKIIFLLILFTVVVFSDEIEFSQIENWTAADTVDQYDSSNLWEYINGAADLFIVYGFQNLYSYELTSDSIEIVLDVYNMDSRLNAFGMYKTERGEIEEKLPVGIEAAITSPNQSLMLKDRYYIKLNVYEGELSPEKNKDLLQSIATNLPGSENFPPEFNLLPQDDKIKNSEHFARESYLGLSELKNCLYADYKVKDKDFQYFVIIPIEGENETVIWNRFSEKWKSIDINSHQILNKKIPYSGIVGIIKTENGIFGVTNCETTDQLIERIKIIIGD
jgi:hypothetical protein